MRARDAGVTQGDAPRSSGAGLDRWIDAYFRGNSRTFSLATRLLPRRVRRPVAVVYWYCRTIDNIADRPAASADGASALDRLDEAGRALDRCLAGRPDAEPLWTELARVHAEWRLPEHTLRELIEGARWDLEGRPIRTMDDLTAYSELVAGSIGEMMLPFLTPGSMDASARPVRAARALGVAMQITNILRDVGEDLHVLGRSYLPQDLCGDAGMEPGRAPEPSDAGYRRLVERLMEEAESRYASGLEGIERLDPGARLGIRAAARAYREILNEVRANRYDNWSRRAVVPLARRIARVATDGYERRKRTLVRRAEATR